jgi:hypothetical protein
MIHKDGIYTTLNNDLNGTYGHTDAGLKTEFQKIIAHSNSPFLCEGKSRQHSMSNQQSPVWIYYIIKKSDENDDPLFHTCSFVFCCL